MICKIARSVAYPLGTTCLTCLLVLLMSVNTASASDVRLEARILQGTPGPSPELTFSASGSESLNVNGDVASGVIFSGPGVGAGNLRGYYRGEGFDATYLLRESDIIPGTHPPEELFILDGFGTTSINASGRIATVSPKRVVGESWDGTYGIFVADGLNLTPVALQDHPCPILPDVNYGLMPRFVSQNDQNDVLFRAELVGAGVDAMNGPTAILDGPVDNLTVLARTRTLVESTTPDITIEDIPDTLIQFPLNSSGETAFRAEITAIDGSFTNRLAVIAGTAGNLRIAANPTDPITGIGPAGSLTSVFSQVIALNNHGQVAFQARIFGDDVTAANDTAIIVETDNGLTAIAQDGDAVSTENGTVLIRIDLQEEILFNDLGEVFFVAGLVGAGVNGTNNEAILRADANGLEIVARLGDAAIGTEPDTVFDLLLGFSINSIGDAAVSAILSGPNVTTSNNRGVWGTKPDGSLALVARRGEKQLVRIEPCATRFETITSASIRGSTSPTTGGPMTMNDAGQIALFMGVENGFNGIYVGQLVENTGCSSCPGDVNEDGDITGTDVQALVDCLLSGDSGNCACGDLNLDGSTDDGDVCLFTSLLVSGAVCD